MGRLGLGRWVDAFVPARLADDVDGIRRARILIVGSWLMGVASTIGFVYRYAEGFDDRLTVVGGMATVLLFLLTPLVLRFVGRLAIAASFPAFGGIVSMTLFAARDGGVSGPSLIGLPALPLFVTLLGGPRLGLFFGFAAIASLFALGALESAGVVVPPAVAPTPWMAIVSATVVTGFVAGISWVIERERRIVESRLRESERRYALAIEGAGEGLFDWNATDRSVFYASGFRALVGDVRLDPAEPFPRTLVHADDFPATMRAIVETLAGRARLAIECRLSTERGYRWFLVKGELAGLEGRPGKRLVGAIQDIHARKEAERVREEIVAIVSHELRTPLTSVYGAIRLLARDADKTMPTESARLVALAERNASRLLTLINDLLDLKRIEEGRLTLQPEEIHLDAFVRSVVESHVELAAKSEVGLVVGEASADAVAFVDPQRMEQVLVNLISNAIKFANARTDVVVSVIRLESSVRLTVANQGDPLERDARERIFAKFGQVDSSTRRRRAGSGLGLAIAKAIVDAHRGTIGYTSQEGWTTFFVELPER